jgi:hypothetical protein
MGEAASYNPHGPNGSFGPPSVTGNPYHHSSGAGPLSIASLGLSTLSTLMEGQGKKSGFEFQADKAERAAEFGRLQSRLTDTTMRQQLNTTLGNIDAIRGAANIDPTSPTTSAIRDWNQKVGDTQRVAKVMSINAQADEDEASAKYLREAGDFALKTSYLKAGANLFGKFLG